MNIKRLQALVLALGCYVLLTVTESNAQQCYRLVCNQSQECQAQLGGQDGNCCCEVNCIGGEGGVSCTCTAKCWTACGTNCPSCEFCNNLLAAGEVGFVITPEANDDVRQKHLLAAQVLWNLSGGLSHPVYSGIAEGRSNARSLDQPYPYDYSYKVRVTATQSDAVMDFVFDHPDGYPTPSPVRIAVDEFGNVFVTDLSAEDAERVRHDVDETCSKPELTAASESISLSAEEA